MPGSGNVSRSPSCDSAKYNALILMVTTPQTLPSLESPGPGQFSLAAWIFSFMSEPLAQLSGYFFMGIQTTWATFILRHGEQERACLQFIFSAWTYTNPLETQGC